MNKSLKLAINYSTAAAHLLEQEALPFDYFKYPAWPDTIVQAKRLKPTYVHFPLRVGTGTGVAINSERQQPADWAHVETLMRQTETPFLNLHLSVFPDDLPQNVAATDHETVATVIVEHLVRDVEAVVQRFGTETVMVENDHSSGGRHASASYLPHVVRQVVEETGCGLLLDLSHARLAAEALAMEPSIYLASLPLEHIREVHVTGIQHFGPQWVARLRAARVADERIHALAGRRMDHLPLTDEDWQFLRWSLRQIHQKRWRRPWVIALEYGGIGPLWEAVTDAQVLADQVPKLYALLQEG